MDYKMKFRKDENLNLLLSATNEEISMLSPCQKSVVNLLKEGHEPVEVSRMLGKSRSYSVSVMSQAVKSIKKIRSGDYSNCIRRENSKRDSYLIDYQKYCDCDFSILSNTERAVLEVKLSAPGITIKDICIKLGISEHSVRMSLSNAVKKLEGLYQEKRDYHRKYNKKYREEHKEYYQKYREEHR